MFDFEKILNLPSPLAPLTDTAFDEKALKVYVKRDDLIHAQISGNKWRKLKYNLLQAKSKGYSKLITFGGAHSNHLYAMAAAGKYLGFETRGIIRGDELNENSSITLQYAHQCGMHLLFVSREAYREKENLLSIYRKDDEYIVPEGGSNALAMAGVAEMYQEITSQLGYAPDYIFCPIGSGGTMAGLINVTDQTRIMGVCVLKNAEYLETEILNLIENKVNLNKKNFRFFHDFHQGGYAKNKPELKSFIEWFQQKHGFDIEHVYSGKMFYAFYELLKTEIRPDSTVVLIHTGGLR
ncbi:1-aminocyclopropane-1-carboxylate deaminase/D-cysteine desulfhydrase [Emticicia sp. 21SJ11W-3]|uniref:1-aminocyclopropane-1-carboxylate deaminase/D-cysteine desulfhydrase n=1 Tax=Emticicia sp. 21SJ11W-3 TaxID=2916755 RepID=UPI00209DF798|nr:pyridoxal-phosphate dependent enzyme [Emticicia sp. 21SJ11W-3]UTA70183.1 pyridoxal-phosphate dependent enzyme [Emticicia sp. 21SJ11W-3]